MARFRGLLHHSEHAGAEGRNLAGRNSPLGQRYCCILRRHWPAHGSCARKGLLRVLTAAFLALGIACLLLLDPATRTACLSLLSHRRFALLCRPRRVSIAACSRRFCCRARPHGRMDLCDRRLDRLRNGNRHGSEPRPRSSRCLLPPRALPFSCRSSSRRPPAHVRELALTAFVLLAALLLDRILSALQRSPQLTQVDRGRQVYISEGCIHCHSQYVRPNSPDELMWGPVEIVAEIREQHPPLIGNRRQGPDLSQVGARRSALWLKAHFFNPAEVSGSSIMPSYGFLFRDERGNDLVAYLESLHGNDRRNIWPRRSFGNPQQPQLHRQAPLKGKGFSGATAPAATALTAPRAAPGNRALNNSRRIFPRDRTSTYRPKIPKSSAEFVSRKSLSSASPELICQDTNISPTRTLPPSVSGYRRSSRTQTKPVRT